MTTVRPAVLPRLYRRTGPEPETLDRAIEDLALLQHGMEQLAGLLSRLRLQGRRVNPNSRAGNLEEDDTYMQALAGEVEALAAAGEDE